MSNIFALQIILFMYITNTECGFFSKRASISVSPHYVRNCKTDKDTRQIFDLRHFKYNHTNHAIDLNWTVQEPFDNSYKIHVELQKWSDGGWKMNFLNVDRNDACSTLELILGSTWTDALKASGMNRPHCPIEPGFYKLSSYYGREYGKKTEGFIESPLVVSPGVFYCLIQAKKIGKISICVEFVVEFSESYD